MLNLVFNKKYILYPKSVKCIPLHSYQNSKTERLKTDEMARASNPITWETEAGGLS